MRVLPAYFLSRRDGGAKEKTMPGKNPPASRLSRRFHPMVIALLALGASTGCQLSVGGPGGGFTAGQPMAPAAPQAPQASQVSAMGPLGYATAPQAPSMGSLG